MLWSSPSWSHFKVHEGEEGDWIYKRHIMHIQPCCGQWENTGCCKPWIEQGLWHSVCWWHIGKWTKVSGKAAGPKSMQNQCVVISALTSAHSKSLVASIRDLCWYHYYLTSLLMTLAAGQTAKPTDFPAEKQTGECYLAHRRAGLLFQMEIGWRNGLIGNSRGSTHMQSAASEMEYTHSTTGQPNTQ